MSRLWSEVNFREAQSNVMRKGVETMKQMDPVTRKQMDKKVSIVLAKFWEDPDNRAARSQAIKKGMERVDPVKRGQWKTEKRIFMKGKQNAKKSQRTLHS